MSQTIVDRKTGTGYPCDSSRFLSHQDQMEALRLAEREYKRTARGWTIFDMGRSVGEGYKVGAGQNGQPAEYLTTSKVLAVFNELGQVVDLLPVLK